MTNKRLAKFTIEITLPVHCDRIGDELYDLLSFVQHDLIGKTSTQLLRTNGTSMCEIRDIRLRRVGRWY